MFVFVDKMRFASGVPFECGLVLEAAFCLLSARAALTVLSFKAISRRLETLARNQAIAPESPEATHAVARAILRAARLVPSATCLVRAVAGMWMLARRGCSPRLCIGVARREDAFAAHAWVECNDAEVIGSGTGFSKIAVVPGGAR